MLPHEIDTSNQCEIKASSYESLLSCVLYPRQTTLMLVLDLSSPSELWFTMETLLNAAKTRLDEAIQEAKADDPYIKDKLRKKAWERIGEEHQVSQDFFFLNINFFFGGGGGGA